MSSPAIEQEGLVRSLAVMAESGVSVSALVTDQHAGITKMMREKYPDIEHWYDDWHVVKGDSNLQYDSLSEHHCRFFFQSNGNSTSR